MIPHRMPELIVDPLEVIDIQHDHCQVQPIPLGPVKLVTQPLLEIPPVVDPGQRIGHRQRPQLLLHPLEVRDIGQVPMPERAAVLADLRRCLPRTQRNPARGRQTRYSSRHGVRYSAE